MNLEDRLNSAASELNQSAAQSAPPPVAQTGEGMRPWLAFTAAFALVIAVIGIPLLISNVLQGGSGAGLLGSSDTTTTTECIVPDPTTNPDSTLAPGAEGDGQETVSSGAEAEEGPVDPSDCEGTRPTTASTASPTTTGVGFVCEASEYGPPTTVAYDPGDGSDERNLTEAVADKFTRIAYAARECDYNAIATLASENFTTSFGGGGVENIAHWHDEGTPIYSILLEVMNTSHGVVPMEDGGRLYVWPAAFAYDTWNEIPEQHVAELLAFHTEEEISLFAEFGSYGGWRIGITESGEWLFFVAGD